MRDTPEYLDAPDNENSEAECECGSPVLDEGRFPELCFDCTCEAELDEYWDRKYDEMKDREYDDYDERECWND